MIGNISISSIDACERSFLHPQKEALTRYENKSVMKIVNGHFSTEKGPHQILIGAFIEGEKGHLRNGDSSLIREEKGHVSLLKGKLSDVKRGTYNVCE